MLNNAEKIATIVFGACTALTISSIIKTKRETKRIERRTEQFRDIQANLEAYFKIEDRILKGEYEDKPLEDIKVDFEFERMTYFEK